MIKSVCLGLVMVLLLVQLNASHHHHHMKRHMRHHSEHHHHHQSLHETSIGFLESNDFWKGYWSRITGNKHDADFLKASEALNQRHGASAVSAFNQKLARINNAWNLLTFAPHYNSWNKQYRRTEKGEEAAKALRALFMLTVEHWDLVFKPFVKKAGNVGHLKGLAHCGSRRYRNKLPPFNSIFGADWEKKFKSYTQRLERKSGHFAGKLVLAMSVGDGKKFCQKKPRIAAKVDIEKKQKEIEQSRRDIKKAKAEIQKKEKLIVKKKDEIEVKKVEVQKEEQKKEQLQKVEQKLEVKTVDLLKKRADLVAKKADIVQTPQAKAEAQKAVAEAKKAEAKLRKKSGAPSAATPAKNAAKKAF